MPYVVPEMPLLCDVYTGPWPTKVLRIPDLPCNLAMGRRSYQNFGYYAAPGLAYGMAATLLIPPLEDIRGFMCGVPADIIECPQGSGRWYQVADIEDIGKGFPNEYRAVALVKLFQGRLEDDGCDVFWPIPIP